MNSGISQEHLRVKCNLNIVDLLQFDMKIEKNNHIMAFISGIVEEDTGIKKLLGRIDGEEIAVVQLDDKEEEINPPIFAGIIKEVEVTYEGQYYVIHLVGMSATISMDLVKKSRSFQNINLTYNDIVNEVLKEHPNSSVNFNIADKKIETPIIQYEETDWEFFKRMASDLCTSIVPVGISHKPQFYFGFPKGREKENIHTKEKRVFFNKDYYKFSKLKYNFAKRDFVIYEIKGYSQLQFGDDSTWNNEKLYVCEKSCSLNHGILEFKYKFAKQIYFSTPQYFNNNIKGISFIGTVLNTKEELIKIHLDIDQIQKEEEAYWF